MTSRQEAPPFRVPRLLLAGGRRTNLVPTLVDVLRREILEGPLQPGERLPTEAAIGVSAGVSRTVVREAVASLKAEGLVATRQGAGAYVLATQSHLASATSIEAATVEDIVSILELRLAIEVEAAALAAARHRDGDLTAMRKALTDFSTQRRAGRSTLEADARFHKALASATRNARFAGCLESLGEFAFPRRHLPNAIRAQAEADDRLDLAEREHRAIYDAVAAGDAAMAASCMRLHLGGSKLRYAALARERPQPRAAGSRRRKRERASS
jgi:DNA-binding FadR family transcriptional regulator